jgi:hypothetical protein
MRFEFEISKVAEALIAPHVRDELVHSSSKTQQPFRVDVPFTAERKPSLTREERFSADAFSGFVEIGETVERLQDLHVYIRRFPFSGTRITRERYLRVHIEAYFQELYILRERLLSYGKRITRAYRSGPAKNSASIAGQRLEELVLQSMAQVIAVHSRHVHESRFDETRLRNLGGIELIARNSPDPIWAPFVKQQYEIVRHHWSRWAKEMNQAVELLLDQYFAILYPVLFEGPSKLRFPGNRGT